MRITRLLGWSLLFLASCKYEASCGNNDGLLNTKKGEKVISDWLEKQGMPPEQIVCPHDIKMTKDADFVCKATIANADGLVIDVSVAQTNGKGDIKLSHGSKIVPTENVERGLAGQIKDQTGNEVTVNCGARVRLAVPMSTFHCTVKNLDESYQFEITVLDETGGWQAKRL